MSWQTESDYTKSQIRSIIEREKDAIIYLIHQSTEPQTLQSLLSDILPIEATNWPTKDDDTTHCLTNFENRLNSINPVVCRFGFETILKEVKAWKIIIQNLIDLDLVFEGKSQKYTEEEGWKYLYNINDALLDDREKQILMRKASI